MMKENVTGKNIWVIPDGFMSDTQKGNYVSHEAICALNLSGRTAHIDITVYFSDRDPMSGFSAICDNERSNHIRLDIIKNNKGEAIPKEVPYSVLIQSDAPIIVQHSRMDVSQPEMTLMTTISY